MTEEERMILYFRQPLIVSKGYTDAGEVLDQFFTDFTLNDAREETEELCRKLTATGNNEEKSISNLRFFCDCLLVLLEACYLINNRIRNHKLTFPIYQNV